MKTHIILCLIQGGRVSHRPIRYLLMTRCCISSLLKCGVNPNDITCIAEDGKHCKILKKEFNINVIKGPKLFSPYNKICNKKRSRKLFFYKVIATISRMPKPIDKDTTMIISDVDSLFVKNPNELSFDTDVYAQNTFTYLRSTRINKIEHPHPNKKNFKELVSYFGGKTEAYLFLKKYKKKKLPKFMVNSCFVAIKPNKYSELIKKWDSLSKFMILSNRKYIRGDQEILSSAIGVLGMSVSKGPKDKWAIQFGSKHKKDMIRRAKEENLIDIDIPGRKKPGRKKPGRKKPGRKKPGRKKPGRKKPGRKKPALKNKKEALKKLSKTKTASDTKTKQKKLAVRINKKRNRKKFMGVKAKLNILNLKNLKQR